MLFEIFIYTILIIGAYLIIMEIIENLDNF